jgi:hypothetical protein
MQKSNLNGVTIFWIRMCPMNKIALYSRYLFACLIGSA